MKNINNSFLDKIDLNILIEYHEKKLIDTKAHLTEDLLIHNYSRKVQYEEAWDDYTMACRGLITDLNGNIVARPLKKFFNMSQLYPPQIPNENFKVYNKEDGSCIITYFAPIENKFLCATRGSFTSEQAIRANVLIAKQSYQNVLKEFNDFTFVFEYVSPNNRIVVKYDYEDLILIAVIHKTTGEELPIEKLDIDWRKAKLYTVGSLEEVRQRELNDTEGTVIMFTSGFRMKVKNKEYLRLHRILTQVSNLDIWECLKLGNNLNQFLEDVPDEFDSWVRETIKEIQDKALEILEPNKDLYNYELVNIKNRKKIAEVILKNQKHNTKIIPSVCFALVDEKDHMKPIWDLVRPTYKKPFSEDIES